MDYQSFLESKSQIGNNAGFKPRFMPSFLFDFQAALVDWSVRKGRGAIMAGTGLGKTGMQLTWAQNVVQETNGAVMVLTPLAVSAQTVQEAEKFGIEAKRADPTKAPKGVVVTNYERLHYYDPNDFTGVVVDEAGCLKNFSGVRKAQITEFMRRSKYRLLCSATPAPNDYIELGTSSEALGELGYMDMLGMFFKNEQNSLHPTSGRGRFERGALTQNKWRFKGHAERHFWRWVCSWARAVRKPSDMDESFDDSKYILPPLVQREHVVKRDKPLDGFLFTMPAVGLKEQREERKATIEERCQKAADLIIAKKGEPSIAWCHLNAESDLLEKMIPGSKQICGSQSDDEKEELWNGFLSGQFQKLVLKPKIGAWGINAQICAHMTFFMSDSFEQVFQGIRRCWRFGQTRQVDVDFVATEGELGVLDNLRRKEAAAERMLDALTEEMKKEIRIERNLSKFENQEKLPAWMKG